MATESPDSTWPEIGPDGVYDYVREVRYCHFHNALAGPEAEECTRAFEYPTKTACAIVDATLTWSF